MQHHSAVAIAKNAVAIAKIMGEQCVGVRIGLLHRLVARRFEQGLAPLDLTLPRLELLAWLTLAGGPVRPATLADRLAVERSTMSRNLARLEKLGADRRAVTDGAIDDRRYYRRRPGDAHPGGEGMA